MRRFMLVGHRVSWVMVPSRVSPESVSEVEPVILTD